MENLIKESIKNLNEVGKKAPKLEGVPSGVEGLDELFFTSRIQDSRALRVPLGGIPRYAIVNLTGISDTGKSLMVEQFAVKQAARGKRVAFITVETPAAFLSVGLKERALAMGFQESDEIEKNIYIIDAASYSALREDIKVLLDTLAYAIKTYKIDFTIIDSLTGLYEAKEMLARTFVRQVYNFRSAQGTRSFRLKLRAVMRYPT